MAAGPARGSAQKSTMPRDAVRTVADRLRDEMDQIGAPAFTAADYKVGPIKHIVLFRYRAEVTSAQKDDVRRRFLALRSSARRNDAPYIEDILSGDQSSGEGADQGFEQASILTFRSEGDRNYYVGTPIVTDPDCCDPAHDRFKAFVGPLLRERDGALVFDFLARAD